MKSAKKEGRRIGAGKRRNVCFKVRGIITLAENSSLIKVSRCQPASSPRASRFPSRHADLRRATTSAQEENHGIRNICRGNDSNSQFFVFFHSSLPRCTPPPPSPPRATPIFHHRRNRGGAETLPSRDRRQCPLSPILSEEERFAN